MARAQTEKGLADVQKRLETFSYKCPLFATLTFGWKVLSRYYDIRKYPPGTTVLSEGESTDMIHFIL